MAKELTFTIAFALTTFFHYLSLYLQNKHKVYTKRLGKQGFLLHFIITTALWTFIMYLFPFNSQLFLISLPEFLSTHLSLIIKNMGFILIIWASLLLGIKRMWGIRYFDKSYKDKIEKRGIYKIIKDPIYNGFILYFIGKTLSSNSLFYLFIALEAYLLLNIFLASFENKEIK